MAMPGRFPSLKPALAVLLALTGAGLVTSGPAVQAQETQAPTRALQTSDQLQQLVAPLALYPDTLVAQILTAATFPEQVVQADRWVLANPELTGDALGRAVDQQPWDPSVKALCAFPAVLGNMDKNLAWTSSLGDAYYNQPQDVMDAIQALRRRSQEAGTLRNNDQESISTQDDDITIEPADPDVVFIPAYDPWLCFGEALVPWPSWYPFPGIWFAGPSLSYGPGCRVSYFRGYGWGGPRWRSDWRAHKVLLNNHTYASPSPTFFNRSASFRTASGHAGLGAAPLPRNGEGERTGPAPRPFEGSQGAARGYAEPGGQQGVRSGAFTHYDHGGQTKGFASRGSASLGGGGGTHGGGGTPHSGAGGTPHTGGGPVHSGGGGKH